MFEDPFNESTKKGIFNFRNGSIKVQRVSENTQTTTTPEKQGLSFHHGEIKIQRIQSKQQETTLQDKERRIEGNSETFSKTVKKRDFEESDAEFEDKIEEIFDIPEEKSIQEPSNEQQTNEISQENVQEKTENTQEKTENSQEETEPQQEKTEENLPEMINPYDEVIHCLQEETCLTINQTLTTLKTTIIQEEEKNQEVQQEEEKKTMIQEIQTQLETFFAEMKNQPVDKEIKPHEEITPEPWKPFFIIGILSSITFIATLIVFLLAQGKGGLKSLFSHFDIVYKSSLIFWLLGGVICFGIAYHKYATTKKIQPQEKEEKKSEEVGVLPEIQKEETPKKERKISKKTIWRTLAIFMILLIVLGLSFCGYRLKKNIFEGLPDVAIVKDIKFQETTVITDRNGNEIYKLFEQNREYVDLDKISQKMINAIISIEDQRFWSHDGVDPWGILRSAIKMTGGGSTIPQQLMTNLFDLKEDIGETQYGTFEYYQERIKYKLRQIVLAKRLNEILSEQVKEEKPNLSDEEIKYEMKRKILELYLNYIEFGNNSFGIEAASKGYFKTSAKDLTLSQAVILASLPKGPTQYSPFTEEGKKHLLGEFIITDTEGNTFEYTGEIKQKIDTMFAEAIQGAKFDAKKTIDELDYYLIDLGDFTFFINQKRYKVVYSLGRKDAVLLRMFVDQYISEEEMKQAMIEAFNLTFYKTSIEIKYPHFTFWVRQLLEEQYGKLASTKGWIVKTSLDPIIQEKAENLLKENKPTLTKNGANNSAMLYLDSSNGDVLAYVGSLDYYDKTIEGQNDMIQKPRQSGSSIKPLLYALGFIKLPLTLDTPIYDLFFKVSGGTVHNANGGFEGLLPLKKALGHSRNIPSVKIFYAVGGENVVKPFYKSLGITSLADDFNYNYNLSLGGAEVPMIELAQAYAHLTTRKTATINPIISITTKDGSEIYSKNLETDTQEEVIPIGVKYLIWKILSDPNNRISGWISKFNIQGLTYALKTGTSNVGKYARDGWMFAYVPNKMVLMRAGNTNAKAMKTSSYGGEIHAETIKKFMKWLFDNKYIQNSEMPYEEVKSVRIGKYTGKLANKNAPKEYGVDTLGYEKNLPTATEKGVVFEYDAGCAGGGLVSPLTDVIKKGYFIENFSSFMPNNDDKNDIMNYLKKINVNIFSKPTQYCAKNNPKNLTISINVTNFSNNDTVDQDTNATIKISSNAHLDSYILYLDNQKIGSKTYPKKSKKSDFFTKELNLDRYENGQHSLRIEVSAQGTKSTKTITFNLKKRKVVEEYVDIVQGNTNPPQKVEEYLIITSNLKNNQEFTSPQFSYRVQVESNGNIGTVRIKLDNTILYENDHYSQHDVTINSNGRFDDFLNGNHVFLIEAYTERGKKETKKINLIVKEKSRENPENQEESMEEEREKTEDHEE